MAPTPAPSITPTPSPSPVVTATPAATETAAPVATTDGSAGAPSSDPSLPDDVVVSDGGVDQLSSTVQAILNQV